MAGSELRGGCLTVRLHFSMKKGAETNYSNYAFQTRIRIWLLCPGQWQIHPAASPRTACWDWPRVPSNRWLRKITFSWCILVLLVVLSGAHWGCNCHCCDCCNGCNVGQLLCDRDLVEYPFCMLYCTSFVQPKNEGGFCSNLWKPSHHGLFKLFYFNYQNPLIWAHRKRLVSLSIIMSAIHTSSASAARISQSVLVTPRHATAYACLRHTIRYGDVNAKKKNQAKDFGPAKCIHSFCQLHSIRNDAGHLENAAIMEPPYKAQLEPEQRESKHNGIRGPLNVCTDFTHVLPDAFTIHTMPKQLSKRGKTKQRLLQYTKLQCFKTHSKEEGKTNNSYLKDFFSRYWYKEADCHRKQSMAQRDKGRAVD